MLLYKLNPEDHEMVFKKRNNSEKPKAVGAPLGTASTGKTVRTKSIGDAQELIPGDNHYRAYVGPPDRYDFMGATQFALLFHLGLRDRHTVLDFGCGSMRLGRLLIPYLQKGGYHGLDPNKWLIEEGLNKELGDDAVRLKSPRFAHNDDFNCDVFNEKFDFIIAQSILTHTGVDLFKKFLETAAACLKPNGLVLFTVLHNKDEALPLPPDGWLYPDCTIFHPKTVQNILGESPLTGKLIPWYHKISYWYCAGFNEDMLPTDDQLQFLTGTVLRDEQLKASLKSRSP